MKLSKDGFTLVEIMIVVAIIALLAAIAIPNLLRAKLQANDSAAKSHLKSLSTSSETFASINSGSYPTEITSLTGVTPPYISQSFCGSTVAGYAYDCTFTSTGYTFSATPLTVGTSGTTTYTITTGSILTP